MNPVELLFNNTKGLSCDNLLDSIGEFANMSLFELQNIRCTSSQHSIVNFMIEFRKANEGLLPVRNEDVVKQIEDFYQESLWLNSPIVKDLIL